MKTLAAGNHYQWQVEIGCHSRNAAGTQILWHMFGYGCLVHSQIVLTSNAVWLAVEEEMYRRSEVMVRIGRNDYQCKLGYQDEERNLAALVLAQPAKNVEGKSFKSFPTVAETPPSPGQALGMLMKQHLHSENNSSASGGYVCYTYGYVSLLQSKDELLFGLSGLEGYPSWFGNVMFDEAGRVYGIATDFLRTSVEARFRETSRGFLVFSPVYSMAKAAKKLALKDAKPAKLK